MPSALSAALLALLALTLFACAGAPVNLPPVASGGADRTPGKILWHDLVTDDYIASKRFYAELFGWTYAELQFGGARYSLIEHDGRVIGGMVDQDSLSNDKDISQWIAVMAVTDIDAATQQLVAGGGTLFAPPAEVGDRGTLAVVSDPQGAVFALLQTASGDGPDMDELPAVGDFLWDELWADDVAAAASFYEILAPFDVAVENLGAEQNGQYRVLSTRELPRAGIRPNPFDGLQPLWVNYLRMADAQQLDAVVARVSDLGGEVLVEPLDRPAGGRVALIAGPSGAGIALQTWSDDETLNDRIKENSQ